MEENFQYFCNYIFMVYAFKMIYLDLNSYIYIYLMKMIIFNEILGLPITKVRDFVKQHAYFHKDTLALSYGTTFC